MSFISMAALRPDTAAARNLARDLLLETAQKDAGHRLVWSLFATDPAAGRDFVFRAAETGGLGNRFLIVSRRQPAYDPAVWDISTKPYAPALTAGQRYGFALRVNPVRSISRPDRKPSLRVDVLMHAEKQAGQRLDGPTRERLACDWLAEKLARAGAELDPAACRIMAHTQLRLPRRAPQGQAVLSVLDTEGALTMRDPVALGKALVDGIGHGKAFGLGLLLLRPLGDMR
jgi:CRISPR system Cascade subunit CasE